MSMILILGVPFAVWGSAAALLFGLICLGVHEWGQRNLLRKQQ